MAHLELPDTLDGAEKALKKHEDFATTMDANEDKILNTIDGGQRLVDNGNLHAPKVKDKINSIQDRSEKFNTVCDKYLHYIYCFKFTYIKMCVLVVFI